MSRLRQISRQRVRFYRLWNEECAAWETYKQKAGWF